MTGAGAVIFIIGSVTNLSAVGAAAAGNLPSSATSFSLGFALELAACAILVFGLKMKGTAQTARRAKAPSTTAPQAVGRRQLLDLERLESPPDRRHTDAAQGTNSG